MTEDPWAGVPILFDEVPKVEADRFRVQGVEVIRRCDNLVEVVVGGRRLWFLAGDTIAMVVSAAGPHDAQIEGE